MKKESFRVDQSDKGNEYVLSLYGELDLSVVPQLTGAVDHVLRREDCALVFDLHRLTYIDSTGIGIIVSILKTRDSINAPFYVRNIPERIRRLFNLTGLTAYIKEGTEAGS